MNELEDRLRDLRVRGVLGKPQNRGVLANPLRTTRDKFGPPRQILSTTPPPAPVQRQSSGGGTPPIGLINQFSGGGGFFGGGGGAVAEPAANWSAAGSGGGGSGWMSAAGPWAALAAVIIGNEREAKRGGYRDEDDWEYAKDLIGGKVFEQDVEKRWSKKLDEIHPYVGAHAEAAANIATLDFSNAWDDLRRGFKELF